MILCDSNVWLAIALSKHTFHAAARTWLDGVDEASSILFCRATQQSFLRLLTSEAVTRAYGNAPLTNRQAWRAFETLLDDDRIRLRTDEPEGLESTWKRLAIRGDATSPKLWMDAYLAAFAVASGARLATTDHAFRAFSGLDVLVIGASS